MLHILSLGEELFRLRLCLASKQIVLSLSQLCVMQSMLVQVVLLCHRSPVFRVSLSRIHPEPHARRRGGTDVRVLMPSRRVKVLTEGRNSEIRTTNSDNTEAYNENMLPKGRIMDCTMHSRLRDNIICLEARHDLKTR